MRIYLRWVALGLMVGFPLGARLLAADDVANTSGSDGSTAATDCQICPSAGCGCCPPEWKIVAGAEEQFLWSQAGNRNDVITVNGASVLGPGFGELGGFQPAGLGWLGVENCNGTGIRTRYWNYDQSNTDFRQPGPELVGAGSSLHAYTVDLEATEHVDWDCWNILGSFAHRYASLNETALFSDEFSNFAVSPIRNDSLGGATESQFQGTGFTTGLEATHPLGDGGVNFITTGRGSVLFGESSSTSVARQSQGSVNSITSPSSNSASETHYIVEFQSGLEWSTYVPCIHGVMFFRGVFEYQLWSGQDAPTSVNGFAGSPFLVVSSPSQKVDFLGPALSAGVCW